MPKRVRKPSAQRLPVKMVRWVDARAVQQDREPLDLSSAELWTIGLVVHEDKAHIVLANEIEAHNEYMNDEMRYMQIPKAWILEERLVGDVEVYSETPSD